jgi:hypothetical protein
VWVDGVEYGTEIKAARGTGLAVSTIHDALRAGGRAVKGRMITPEPPPKPCAAELAVMGLKEPGKRKLKKTPEPPLPESGEPEAEGNLSMPWGRKPLLRYPPGEGPLYQGSRRWR